MKKRNPNKYVPPRAIEIPLDKEFSMIMMSSPPGNPGSPRSKPRRYRRRRPGPFESPW